MFYNSYFFLYKIREPTGKAHALPVGSVISDSIASTILGSLLDLYRERRLVKCFTNH